MPIVGCILNEFWRAGVARSLWIEVPEMVHRMSCLVIALLVLACSGCSSQVELKTIKPNSAGLISWDEAKKLLLDPRCKYVTEMHDNPIRIILEENAVHYQFSFAQPVGGDYEKFLKQYDLPNNSHILFVTE